MKIVKPDKVETRFNTENVKNKEEEHSLCPIGSVWATHSIKCPDYDMYVHFSSYETKKKLWHRSILLFCRLLQSGADDIGITSINDTHDRHREIFTAGGTKVCVVSRVVVNTGFGKHGIVFDLRFTQGWRVVGDNNKLS